MTASAEELLVTMPLIAILRGLTLARAIETAQIIFEAGIRLIEVPLNSPEPFATIERIANHLGDAGVAGAGTVLCVADVQRAYDAGARLIVAPNTDLEVVARALSLKMVMMPGIATPTEAFTALGAGARHLKLFPASTYGPAHLRALLSVLPAQARLYPVGGISAAHIASWQEAGAAGYGLGSELFSPSYSASEVRTRATEIAAAFRQARAMQAAGWTRSPTTPGGM
jgi:2-dehydro-3-deoxyphosphogalactonate aldolase